MISVIVPVYKVEDYLPYCLDSLLNNTYRDIEVICVNDGSPDASGEILKRYKQADSRIRVVNKENGGVTSARNAGLELAGGEWVAFVDADDAVPCNYFECLLEAWEKDGRRADVVVCGRLWRDKARTDLPDYRKTEPMENEPRHMTWNQIRNYMLAWAFVWGKVYRRELIGNMRAPQNLVYAEDVYFNLKTLSRLPTLRCIKAPAAMYMYRHNGASASSTLPKTAMLASFVQLLQDCRTFPSREGRIVASEIAVGYTFAISKSVGSKTTERECRSRMKEGLEIWRRTGFLSKENFVMWVKFCLYYAFPCLNAVGKLVHQFRNR